MADKNVTVTTPAGTVYHFPSCHVARRLDKNVEQMPTPVETTGIDLKQATDSYTLTGRWKDDPGSDYDGLGAFERYVAWMTFWKATGGKGSFSWSSSTNGKTTREEKTIMVLTCDFDKDSGDGAIIEYNIRLAIVKA